MLFRSPTSSFDKEFIIETEEKLERFLDAVERAKKNPLKIEINKDLLSRQLSPERIKELIRDKSND